jgi:DNA-binding NtrC family response regulator
MTKQKLAPAVSRFEHFVSLRPAMVRRPLLRILSVSSAPEDHQTLRQILQDPSWNFSVATNCQEARELLTWNRIAVVICEAKLPDRGWKDLLRHVDEYSEPLTLIVSTARANKYLETHVRRLGGYGLLPKPFDEHRVRRMLARASRLRHKPNRLRSAGT